MTEQNLQIREEHSEDDRPLDVEHEELEPDDEFNDYVKPWNPEDIRVTTKNFSIRNILDLVNDGDLDLAPDFQRLRVWKPKQKSQLIESIILQIPLPAFYFAEDRDGAMRVVDGLQRLSTIYDFVRGGNENGFALEQLEYTDDILGARFDGLGAPLKRRINNTQIVAHVIDPSTPPAVKYDIFRRINTGGTPLTAQEIRHCMSSARSREFLRVQAESGLFREATGGSLASNTRMVDREVVLRFVAFFLMEDISEYRRIGPMEDLLWKTTERLDNPDDLTDEDLAALHEALTRGLELSLAVFGEHAFRKWPEYTERRNPFNRGLFETWVCRLAVRDEAAVRNAADEIARRARTLMTDDYDYLSAITSSTGDPYRVTYRFRAVDRLLDEVLA